MKLRVEQLSSFLTGTTKQLFFLSGDEPLQMMEAADQIRQQARSQGFEEREILSFDGGNTAGTSWSALSAAGIELSLFSQKKMLDVRLCGCQPGASGSKSIREYIDNMPSDQFLLLQTGKLDKNTRNSAWVKALDKQGVMIQIWELSPAQTLAWVAKRMREQGLQPTQDAVSLLTERIEGNLLAADQEIKKLRLLFGQNVIDVDQVIQVVADSSRFTVFDLSDAVLQGDLRRLHHVLTILREEDTPLPLILWSLSTLGRQLYAMCEHIRGGGSEMQAMKVAGFIPRTRQALFPSALRRLQHADWSAILHSLFALEKMSKGQTEVRIRDVSRIWDQMMDTAASLTGKPLFEVSG